MEIPRLWYTVKEVAAKWTCTEDEVLHLIQTHRITPSFLLKETGFRVMRKPADLGTADENGNLLDPVGYNEFFTDFFKNAPIETYSGLFSPTNFDADDGGLLSVNSQWRGELKRFPLIYGLPVYDYEETILFYPAEPIPITHEDLIVTEQEAQRFVTESTKSAVSSDKGESTRLTENLYKTVIAIAIDAYRHDPAAKKNTTVPEILEALKEVGVFLSENTVRDYLKKGAELIEREKTE